MTKFIRNSVLLLLSALFLFMSLYTALVISIREKANFQLGADKTSVVFGHSHSQCAFNDSLIDNFQNLSQSAEPYFYTRIKAKLILRNNPQIKLVFIEFTNNQINKKNEKWTFGNESQSKFIKYSPFLSLKDHLTLIKSPRIYMNNLIESVKYMMPILLKNDIDYIRSIGSYKKLLRNRLDNKFNGDITNENHVVSEISEFNLSQLSLTLDECNLQGTRVFLVRSPVHNRLKSLNNEMEFQKIINSKFENYIFLDFKDFSLPDSDFADFGHLNFKGAGKFSIWFDSIVSHNSFYNE